MDSVRIKLSFMSEDHNNFDSVTKYDSPIKESVILLGCKENPESLYELIKTKGAFSWKKMSQKLTYGRYSTVAFLIPEDFVTCNDSKSTTITSTARSISQTDISISESASFNLYIWLSLSVCFLIGLYACLLAVWLARVC